MSRKQVGPVLVTGAASGIGAAVCRQLLDSGVPVLGLDRDAQPEWAGGMQWLRCDLSSLVEPDGLAPVSETIRAFSGGDAPLGTIVFSAGISAVGPADSLPDSAHGSVLAINLLAPLVLARMLTATGMANAETRWVLLSSLSHFTGYPGAAAYAASKDGVVSLGRCLRRLPGRPKVCIVYPGPTNTPHAARFSPDGSERSNSRMSPERVARALLRASRRGRRMCCPGPGPLVFMLLGALAPRAATRLMRRLIYLRLSPERLLLDEAQEG